MLTHTRELDERAVAHEFDDPPRVAGEDGLDDLSAQYLEALEGAGLVALDQARVADHVRREDGGEPAIDTGSGHGTALRGARTARLYSGERNATITDLWTVGLPSRRRGVVRPSAVATQHGV